MLLPLPLLVLLLLLLATPTITSSPLGLDAFLAAESRRDPLATNDSFPRLPSHLLSTLPPSPLLPLTLSLPVQVILAAPSLSPSAPSVLLSFASAALSSSPFHSLSPPHYPLSLSHSLHLSVSLSPLLSSSISSSIQSHIAASPSPLHAASLHSVPHTVTDDLIRSHYLTASASSPPAFYIYLLHLPPQSRPYAYSYTDQQPSSHFSKCLGTLYTSSDRYLWIDLAAGPVNYGPAVSGDGVLPRGEFHPLAALHRAPRGERALLADLASLTLSAYHTLLVPPLRIPVHFETSLLVQLVHIRDGGGSGDTVGLDFGAIEKAVKESSLEFKHQSLRFDTHSITFSDCPVCSFAVARSTNSFTSRFLFENYTLIVSEYLDSKTLHQILSGSVDEVRRAAGIPEEIHQFGKVLPVYVFDLEYDKGLMLDRYHQAVAFRDMVIAVRTRSSQAVSDYSCNSRNVITQTRNLDRPIVGAVLQSMWGVAPTHLSWSPHQNKTVVDYTWSVGQTPFGPFSESMSLSFAQKDAAKRNVLLTSLNYTISSAIDITESMAAHGGDQKVLKGKRHVEFVQRWNLLKYKLDKVVSAMSQLDYDKAMYFLRSSDHDLYAIHTTVYQATQELEASLVCFKDPPFPWASASMAGILLFGFFYVFAQRGKIFKSKRKQF